MMMQFFRPEWFWAFWFVLVVFALFFWAAWKKKKYAINFAQPETLSVLAASHSSTKERLKKALTLCSMAILVLTIAQPQWGETKKEIRRKGVEIIFLVDTSLSMLAEDIAPSRIEKAKLEMKSFLRKLKGDRLGIVTFAGSGFVQSPLTLDYDAFLLFANSLRVGYIPDVGTSLSEAIRTAVKAFPETKKKHQTVVLLSDGEHQEGDVLSAIETAKEAQIRIYTIGLGTSEGAPIPLRSEDNKVSGYKKDRTGEIVITKLNESLLQKIAEETGGLYLAATPGEEEIDWIHDHMEDLEQKQFKQRLIVEREDHFQSFLGGAILLLFLDMLIGEAKRMKKTVEA